MAFDPKAERSLSETLIEYLKQTGQDRLGPKPILKASLVGYRDGVPMFSVRPATSVEVALQTAMPKLNRES